MTLCIVDAAIRNYKEMVALLLTSKADVDGTNKAGWTALHEAAANNREEVAKLLIAHGANVNAADKGGITPLLEAAAKNNKELVALLLANKADANSTNDFGGTALLDAAFNNHEEVAKLLIMHGANVNAAENNGFTPLMHAVSHEQIEIIKLLLANKADPNVQSRDGESALSIAKGRRADEIVNLLLKGGADEYLQRRSLISVSRNHSEQIIFVKANTYNRYSLFELISTIYNPQAWGQHYDWRKLLDFPDFSRIRINRLLPKEGTTEIKVDLQHSIESGDCSADQWLEWGDVVEIPERGHNPNTPRSIEIHQGFRDCLARTVRIVAKDDSISVRLQPPGGQFGGGGGAGGFGAAQAEQSGLTLNSFDLATVVHSSGLIRESSDLSRIKVTRTDPDTKKVTEMTGPLDTLNLWLRDGDVIEIPEKR